MLDFRSTLLILGACLFTSILARDISTVPLPECGIDCYQAACNTTTDTTCLCSDAGIQNVEGCLTSSCAALSDYFVATRLLYNECDLPRPVWTIDPDYTTTAIVAFVFQTLFFALRVSTKLLRLGTWGWDDGACAVAYVFCITQFVLCVLIGQLGEFNNYWTLDFDNLPPAWKFDFARGILYAFTLAASKTAILCFYQRCFGMTSRIRYILWATHVYNVLLALSYMIQALLISKPVRCNWELDLEQDCTYKDVWFGSGGYSACNAVLDIVLVLIPAFMVSRLKMSTGKKAGVIAVFATGFLTCLSPETDEYELINVTAGNKSNDQTSMK
ncbi:hypothetical protein N0V93_008118 [Gnomoniopsis smithogilvyi]|uniref:Rhodopsin domain-containing protein n=1 Tax=Gnomoniopsis smithogilvyi TaxID=1191159 RepID=A0A9W8YMD6_9PEZI|nr:hypothetical protein N0V93_008118 [Gnomoniopsis smithogilvyi]